MVKETDEERCERLAELDHEEQCKRMDIEDNQINWEEEEDKVHEIAKEYATPKTKFDLSEKKISTCTGYYYPQEDVKEFIRRLKEEIPKVLWNDLDCRYKIHKIIDKLAGELLI